MPRHVVNPNNTTSSGQGHSDPWNRSSSWWDRSWQSQDQWSDRSWQDNRDWENRARSTQPTSSTETSGWNRCSRASSAATWQEEAARSTRTPRRDSRFTQDRNRRGHRPVAATQRRIDRGQDRRKQAEQAAQRVTTGERRVRSAPPPEEAEASLVPQQARQPEPIPEEELRSQPRPQKRSKRAWFLSSGQCNQSRFQKGTGRVTRGGATVFFLRSGAHSSKGTGRALHQRSPAHSGPASAGGSRRDRSRGS